MATCGIDICIGPKTQFIISTSGRTSSLLRYKIILQEILNVDIAYIPISSKPTNIIDPMKYSYALRGMNCIGGAISRDIKHTIIPYLDSVDELAALVSSVNTVIVRDGQLVGYNTDAHGFRSAISRAFESYGAPIKSAICYGYGGVTSVVVAVLKGLGVEKIFVVGRRLEEAAKRAEEFGVDTWTAGVSAQLFVNATPVTDKPLEEAANFVESIRGCVMAFDHEMPGACLKTYCDENGLVHIPGVDMYYPQMHEQWSLFLEGIVDRASVPDVIAQAEGIAKTRS